MRPILSVVLVAGLAACTAEATPTPKPPCPTEAPSEFAAQAILEDAATATVTLASDDEFVIELLPEAAPIATASFVELARCGFYDGITFHRVIAGFVIQAGDPNTKTHDGDFDGIGTGGPGYKFEIEPPADDLGYDQYSVSMANDRVQNGSQFFIALSDLDEGLQRQYTIFGQVVSGTEVVDAIAGVPVNDPKIGVPVSPVRIARITIAAEAPADA